MKAVQSGLRRVTEALVITAIALSPIAVHLAAQ